MPLPTNLKYQHSRFSERELANRRKQAHISMANRQIQEVMATMLTISVFKDSQSEAPLGTSVTQISDLVESKDSEKLFKDTFCYVVHEELKKQEQSSQMLLQGSKESINDHECVEQMKS